MKAPFRFLGFSPNYDLQSLVKLRLNEVLEESPSDATGGLEIVKRQGRFEGFLKIHALAGRFVAHSMSKDPRRAVEKLVADIRKQVRKWKALRVIS